MIFGFSLFSFGFSIYQRPGPTTGSTIFTQKCLLFRKNKLKNIQLNFPEEFSTANSKNFNKIFYKKIPILK